MHLCPTCHQPVRRRVKEVPLACVICGLPVPWPGRGRRPKVHVECRSTWAKLREVHRTEGKKP